MCILSTTINVVLAKTDYNEKGELSTTGGRALMNTTMVIAGGAIIALLLAGVAVWYFVIRAAGQACDTAAGSAELNCPDGQDCIVPAGDDTVTKGVCEAKPCTEGGDTDTQCGGTAGEFQCVNLKCKKKPAPEPAPAASTEVGA